MDRQTIILVVVIFGLIIAGMVGYASLREDELDTVREDKAREEDPQQTQERYAYIEAIEATHTFTDGTHTLSGEVTLPSPCHDISVETLIAESFPEQVTLQFSITEQNSDLCAQVLTPQSFTVTVEVSENASFEATLAGRPLPLQLVEPGSDGSTME